MEWITQKWPINKLILWDQNPRVISEEDFTGEKSKKIN